MLHRSFGAHGHQGCRCRGGDYVTRVNQAEQGKPDALPPRGQALPQGTLLGAGTGCWRKRMPFCNGTDRGCDIIPLRKQADFQLVVLDERTYRIFEGGNRK